MELRVLKIFVDKETRKQLAEGDIINWEDESRAENAIERGYVEKVVKEPVKPVAKVEEAAEVEKPVKKRIFKKKQEKK